jgi:hypothetical protein
MKTRKGVQWVTDYDGKAYKVVMAPWGTWYKYDHCPPGLWAIKSHEELLQWATRAEAFEGTTIQNGNKRLKLVTSEIDSRGWISGNLFPQKRIVGDIETDEPLIR